MRFRFSIRDLLWLTALIAVLVAWWLDHNAYVQALNTERATTADAKRRLDKVVEEFMQGMGHEDKPKSPFRFP